MFGRLTQTSYEMRNPFIVLRFVLFAILVYVNILILGLAGWNISVLKGLKIHDLSAPTFVIFNACILIIMLAACLVSPWLVTKPVDKVRDECIWTGVMSGLQLASCFSITVNGPAALCQGISVTACASSSLVVALSWISCMILLLYSFSLLTTAITHMNIIPDVWSASIRTVRWYAAPEEHLEAPSTTRYEKSRFSEMLEQKRLSFHYSTPIFEQHAKALPASPLDPPKFPSTPTSPIWQSRKDSAGSLKFAEPALPSRRTTWTSRIMSGAGTLSHKISNESMRPNWAKRASPRRGVDLPFTMPRFSFKPLPPVRPLRPLKLKSHWSQSTSSPPPVPALPPKARVAGPLDTTLSPTSTFYIDLERDAVVPVAPVPRPMSYGMFPEDVIDPDQPVTRSQRIEWVRADSPASSLR
ncbi:hypothetical protein L226DRAFT_609159 [Lentinus tigrinus ALCF2SS1-7]|uniref:Uncharacterized protein n=1 Tax=Lentinus tigrinus ALCF2SS1-6 TaxID=1328759 RepID=A0A5C2SSI3_9APHY|nr:hypothetical protein L227DRAFT_649040 [Lentinus tigrinus ALCF2SS1-6]RPD80223.1 hypothetical protein L226DRAFT_609159 [Lentinus tigrinus ALCF2SS1-7]